jgi:hypothetical protein
MRVIHRVAEKKRTTNFASGNFSEVRVRSIKNKYYSRTRSWDPGPSHCYYFSLCYYSSRAGESLIPSFLLSGPSLSPGPMPYASPDRARRFFPMLRYRPPRVQENTPLGVSVVC